MNLPQLARVSLWFGVWTPVVALVLVWASAGAGAPALDALEGAGVDILDRPAIAAAFAPPLPYLAALLALGFGAAFQRALRGGSAGRTAAKVFAVGWVTMGLGLSGAVALAMHAEHGSGPEPVDAVHVWLLLPAWGWWSSSAIGVTVVLVLRAHVILADWAVRSRAFAATTVGMGALALTGGSVVLVPSTARAAVDDWMPAVEALAESTDEVVLALGRDADEHDEQDGRYTIAECLDELDENAVDEVAKNVSHGGWAWDAEDIVHGARIDVCADEPKRGEPLVKLLQTVADRRAIDALRKRRSAGGNEAALLALSGHRDEALRWDSRFQLECVIGRLSAEERELFTEVFDDQRGHAVRWLMAREGLSKSAADKRVGTFRKKVRAHAEACAGLR
jgi:DNA-directed RNA polymerase specialized sigma24 family protein